MLGSRDPLMKVDVYTHGFKVHHFELNTKFLLSNYCRRFIQYGLVTTGRGRFQRKPVRVYAKATKDRNMYFFHRNVLDDFLSYMKENGITEDKIKIKYKRLYEPAEFELEWVDKNFKLRDYQEPIVEHFLQPEPPIKVSTLQTGKGKGLPLDTLVRVPNGWTAMGDIKVGDNVIAADGTHVSVREVHPQGNRICYKLTFNDGRKVVCDENHLWKITILYADGYYTDVVETKLINALFNPTVYCDVLSISIELAKPELTQSNPELIDIAGGIYDYTKDDRTADELQWLLSEIKTASIEQQKEFLRASFDAYATVTGRGVITFTSVHPATCFTVQYLVRKLGGTADYIESKHSEVLKVILDDPWDYFKSDKRDIISLDKSKLMKPHLEITNIQMVGRRETQCILIDHPDHLHVIKDFIVTHNTATTLYALNRYSKRAVLIMKPMYMKQWVKNIEKHFDVQKGDLLVVKGSKALIEVMRQAKEDELKASIIMISNATYRNYIRSFMDKSAAMHNYPIRPWNFFKETGTGVRVIDELHQDFHLNFIVDCMSNVPKSISLSATMKSDDATMNRIYSIMLPQDSYAPEPAYDRYISVYQMAYRFENPNLIKYKNFMKQYNQTIFEKSIMKRKRVLNRYLDMIETVAVNQWREHENYREGMKLAVYCGLVDMCSVVKERLEHVFPDKDVRRKVDVDPEDNLTEPDVIVTTIKSAGTARDIPDLGVCVSTVALSSLQANIQFIGRLRPLKEWPDITPRFFYLYCRDIDKHRKYTTQKYDKLGDKVKDMNVMMSSFVI